MRPVMQTVTELGKGNCLAACLASLLELEIQELPDLNCGNNMLGLDRFLAERNLVAIWLRSPELHQRYVGHTPAHCILIGDSPRNSGVQHAVVGRPNGYGYMIEHDPHPEGGGLAGPPKSVIYLGVLDPSR